MPRALLELCVFLADPPPECDEEAILELPSIGLDFDLPRVNPPIAQLLAGITDADDGLIAAGLAALRAPLLFAYPEFGGGPIYLFGISDWSGNHVTLTSTLVLQWLLARTGDVELRDRWIGASAKAWEILSRLEHPLHATLAVAVGAPSTIPPGGSWSSIRRSGARARSRCRSIPMPSITALEAIS